MKIFRKAAALISACVLLTGCASEGKNTVTNSSAEQGSKPKSVSIDPNHIPAEEKPLPVIDIQTKSTDPDAMKFVTEPVSRHVAESISTWTENYVIPPEPYYEECTVTVTDEDSKVLLDSADAEVKVRGNWTTSYIKKPLRIKFTEKKNMLGLNGGNEFKNWVLIAGYKDFSLLRDKASLEVAKELLGKDGYYSSDCKLVQVNINGEYWGVYLLAEQQQVNKNRVNVTSPEKDYTGTDIGYFIEMDGYYNIEEPLNQFKISYHDDGLLKPYDGANGSGRIAHPDANGALDSGFTIKSDIYSQEQHDFIMNFVENTYNIMYEAAMRDKAYVINEDYSGITEDSSITPRQAVENVVDVRSLADMFILSELTCDADIYYSSFYMDADFGEGGSRKLRFEAPWDFDSGLGNKNRCADGTGHYAGNIIYDVNGEAEVMCNPWLMVLMYQDWYRDIIKERWTELYDSGALKNVCEMITTDSEQYEKAFVKNSEKWGEAFTNQSILYELSEAAAECKTEKQAAEYLRSWLEARVEFMNSEWYVYPSR